MVEETSNKKHASTPRQIAKFINEKGNELSSQETSKLKNLTVGKNCKVLSANSTKNEDKAAPRGNVLINKIQSTLTFAFGFFKNSEKKNKEYMNQINTQVDGRLQKLEQAEAEKAKADTLEKAKKVVNTITDHLANAKGSATHRDLKAFKDYRNKIGDENFVKYGAKLIPSICQDLVDTTNNRHIINKDRNNPPNGENIKEALSVAKLLDKTEHQKDYHQALYNISLRLDEKLVTHATEEVASLCTELSKTNDEKYIKQAVRLTTILKETGKEEVSPIINSMKIGIRNVITELEGEITKFADRANEMEKKLSEFKDKKTEVKATMSAMKEKTPALEKILSEIENGLIKDLSDSENQLKKEIVKIKEDNAEMERRLSEAKNKI